MADSEVDRPVSSNPPMMASSGSSVARLARGLTVLARPALRPLKLTILVTYMCQSRCNHCDIWKFYRGGAPDQVGKELRLDDYKALFRAVSDSLVWIEVSGGEATLRSDFPEIIVAAHDLTRIANCAITTNGLNPTRVVSQVRSILDRTGGRPLTVGVSVDGYGDSYTKVRGVDSYERVLKTYLALKALTSEYGGLRPHIAYTISRFNAGQFSDFYQNISRSHGVKIEEISFTFEHFVGFYFQTYHKLDTGTTTAFHTGLMKDIGDIRTLQRGAETKLSSLTLRSQFYQFYLANIETYLRNPERQVIPCTASELSAFVDPYGNVRPCSMWDAKIGNLKEASFTEIWNSAVRLKIRDQVRSGACPNCWTPCEAQPTWLGNLPRVLLS